VFHICGFCLHVMVWSNLTCKQYGYGIAVAAGRSYVLIRKREKGNRWL